jgi:clan AA aspartic protease (TIGR02281 family)
MGAWRSLLTLGTASAFMALAWSGALSQEPAAAGRAPDEILKSHDLKRSSATWVLPDETAVLKDASEVADLYRQVVEGMVMQEQLDYGVLERRAAVEQLRELSNSLSQQIAAADQQLAALVVPPGGNQFVSIQRNEVSQVRNRLALQLNQVNNRINSLGAQGNEQQDQEQKQQLKTEVGQAREKYLLALTDLRTAVDEVTAKYDALAKNPEVTGALDALSASTKTKQHLGPSKALQTAIHALEKAEGSVHKETIDLHREGGVFHVDATLGRIPTKMVFDTGAGYTTISSKLATRIGLKAKPGDPTAKLKTADGTISECKLMIIPSVKVGQFTIANVECAVMPEEKGEVDPLLGQSFLKHFKVEFSAEAGTLKLAKLDTGDATARNPQASTKAAMKNARPSRQPKSAAKTKRSSAGAQRDPFGGDEPVPEAPGSPK